MSERKPVSIVLFLLMVGALLAILSWANVGASDCGSACPRPTKAPTPTSPPPKPEEMGHDVTAWHEPTDHHHGADPATAHPMIKAVTDQYWTQEIGSPWLSGEHENMYPMGAHAGFKNLVENDMGCPKLKPGPDDLCVNAYHLQVHAVGTNAHGLVAVHSWKGAFLVCQGAEISESTCGVVLSGGNHDYGQFHAPYKKFSCKGPDSLVVPDDRVFITPYVALATTHLSSGYNRIFWNSTIAPVMNQYFLSQRGYLPNQGVNIVWAEMDVKDQVIGFSDACADPAQHVDSPKAGDDGTLYQVYSVRYPLPSARPLNAFTDRWGVIRPAGACTAQGIDCVPLVITGNVPQGRVYLNRNVGPTYAPFLDYAN